MADSVVLIKLGGSLITNKSKPFAERREVIADVVSQIKKAYEKNDQLIVVGHGGGSYPHVPAEKYKTIEGNINGQSVYGAAVVEDAAAQLNRIVVGEFLEQKLPAISLNPSSCMVVRDGKMKAFFPDSFREMLNLKMMPVVYGDVVFDAKKKFTIWSTEQILNAFAEKFVEKKMKVEGVIHCGETDGFLVEGKVVDEITPRNFARMKEDISVTEGFDVTGGMLHKVEEALAVARQGIDSYIIGGNHGGNLYRAVVGEGFIGTRVTA